LGFEPAGANWRAVFFAWLDGAGAWRQKIEQPAFKKIKAFKACPGVPC
jgi:hypothetical protein